MKELSIKHRRQGFQFGVAHRALLTHCELQQNSTVVDRLRVPEVLQSLLEIVNQADPQTVNIVGIRKKLELLSGASHVTNFSFGTEGTSVHTVKSAEGKTAFVLDLENVSYSPLVARVVYVEQDPENQELTIREQYCNNPTTLVKFIHKSLLGISAPDSKKKVNYPMRKKYARFFNN